MRLVDMISTNFFYLKITVEVSQKCSENSGLFLQGFV